MISNTEALELQKVGIITPDAQYWMMEFDEEHGDEYDDLAHWGMNEHDVEDELGQAELETIVSLRREYGGI